MNVDTFENIIFNLISCLKDSWWQIIDMKIKHLCSCRYRLVLTDSPVQASQEEEAKNKGY